MRRYAVVRRGEYLELTETGHLLWMRDMNPDQWDDETWRAFTVRCGVDPAFKDRCRREKAAGRPRPHPFEGGWSVPAGAHVGADSIASRMDLGRKANATARRTR